MKYAIRCNGKIYDSYPPLIVDQDGQVCSWDEGQGWEQCPDSHLYTITWYLDDGDEVYGPPKAAQRSTERTPD